MRNAAEEFVQGLAEASLKDRGSVKNAHGGLAGWRIVGGERGNRKAGRGGAVVAGQSIRGMLANGVPNGALPWSGCGWDRTKSFKG
jgi:hypothetical protein